MASRLSPRALGALVCLTLSITVVSILIHVSRAREGATRYKASSAVVLTEIGKLVVSLLLACRDVRSRRSSSSSLLAIDAGSTRESKRAATTPRASLDLEKAPLVGDETHEDGGAHQSSASQLWSELQEDCCSLALPATLFTVQTQLFYFALSNLSVPAYQVASQLKVLVLSPARLTVRSSLRPSARC